MKRASAKGARKTLKVSVKPGHLEQLSGQKCARCPEKRDTGNTGGQLERKREEERMGREGGEG